jgi:hypothetical protein
MRSMQSVRRCTPAEIADRSVTVVCQRGLKLTQGIAAWLRQAGAKAEYLEGGVAAWTEANGLLVRPTHVPVRDSQARTVWVTRTRPKIDRIACPWLIRRFVDPAAVLLFTTSSEVAVVAEEFGATTRKAPSGAIAESTALLT